MTIGFKSIPGNIPSCPFDAEEIPDVPPGLPPEVPPEVSPEVPPVLFGSPLEVPPEVG